MTKEEKERIVADMAQRISDEHRKHYRMDWARLAALKIYATHFTHLRKGLTDAERDKASIEFCLEYYPELDDVTKEAEVFDAGVQWAIERLTRPAITEGELIEIMKNKIALRSWNEPPRLVNGDIVGWELAAAAILTAITPKT